MRTYQLQDFANPISVAVTNPSQSGYSRFVGLEHYDSGELVVKRYSGTELLTTTAKAFETNDILIARRNVYLKRAGIVFFDGITSGDTIVLRIKNDCESATGVPKDLAQRIIPIVLNSEHFWIYANKHADGMNSKRISKEMLLTYEFELPSLEEQRVLADKLWAAYEVKESYKNLLTQTDKLLHAQFYKMFGDETQYRKIADVFTLQMGKTPSRDIPTYFGDEGHTWLSIADMKEDAIFTSASKEKLTDLAIKDCGIKIVPCNTVIMSFKLTVGRLAITNEDLYTNEAIMAFLPKDNSYRTKFVYYLFQHIQWLGDAKLAVKGNTLNKESISNILLPIIGIERQDDFLHIAEQAEQTKATLNKGIAAIEAVIRSLIAEGTTKI